MYQDPNDNTHEEAVTWGNSLARSFNEVAKKENKYPQKFVFASDLTKRTKMEDLDVPAYYVMNEDIMALIDFAYDPEHYSRSDIAEHLTEEYFGDYQDAKQFILDYDSDEEGKNNDEINNDDI